MSSHSVQLKNISATSTSLVWKYALFMGESVVLMWLNKSEVVKIIFDVVNLSKDVDHIYI